jgi:hypothetical protein
LLDHSDPLVREAIAKNHYLPLKCHGKILGGVDPSSKLGLAINTTVSLKILRILELEEGEVGEIATSRIEREFFKSTETTAIVPTTKLQISPSSEPENNISPMVFVSTILGLLCIGMMMVIFSPRSSQEASLQSITASSHGNRGTANLPDPAKFPSGNGDSMYYHKALEFGTIASLHGKNKDIESLKKARDFWKQAIDSLKQIKKGSSYYTSAIAKIIEYEKNLQLVSR